MSKLSPVTQAVLDAYLNAPLHVDFQMANKLGIAAVLRTAADQLINVQWSVEMWELHQEFHAIATELESSE
jgi:hypothetical protein